MTHSCVKSYASTIILNLKYLKNIALSYHHYLLSLSLSLSLFLSLSNANIFLAPCSRTPQKFYWLPNISININDENSKFLHIIIIIIIIIIILFYHI